MKDHLEFFILAAGLIGALIGILGTRLYYRGHTRQEVNKAWRMARIVHANNSKA